VISARRLLAALVALAAVAAVAPGSSVPPAYAATRYLDATFAVDVQTEVLYGTAVAVDGTPVSLVLDLYTPRGDAATNRPVFVWAHGGAFFSGDKGSSKDWAIKLAQRGYVTASINYRLGATPVVVPLDSQYEYDTINNARADMQTAVRWFKANAVTLRIDPDRIAVGGTSAGAVTALGVAANADAPLPGDHPDYSSAVCTAVSQFGANDPLVIGSNDAGAIFHHGTLDTVVPFAMAQDTRDAMVAAGLDVQWHEYAGEGHGLSAANNDLAFTRTVQWLYAKVATASFPCSPSMRFLPRRPAASSTSIDAASSGSANRIGVVSLVAVENTLPGWVQSLPCGAVAGGSSNLNSDAPGQIRATLAIVPFGADGRSCIYNQVPTHLVADLQGYFQPGAFDDVPDQRVLDTRTGARPANGSQTEIRGLPNRTAVVSIAATEATRAGYVQVLPCGSTPGGTSNLNIDAPGQTRAVLAFVRFGADGRACLFAQHATHLVADLQGYLGAAAFDDIADVRVLDSRGGPTPAAGSQTVVRGRPERTAVVSVVADATTGPGYLQFLPCGTAPGSVSNVNTDAAGQTVAGLAFVRFDPRGEACLFTLASTHLVVDVQGYLDETSFSDITDVRLLDTRTR
jgi:acetyl esterase/lipase